MTDREELFWSKVIKSESGCWLWSAATDDCGYGFVMYEGKVERAHRVAYRLTYGPPKNRVLHRCDNPPCINPEHLFDGTQKDNVIDMARKDRHGKMKITLDEAVRIRRECSQGPRGTAARLAREYGVSASCISKIANGIQRV